MKSNAWLVPSASNGIFSFQDLARSDNDLMGSSDDEDYGMLLDPDDASFSNSVSSCGITNGARMFLVEIA